MTQSLALILLHPADNVVVCCRQVHAGENLNIAGVEVVMTEAVDIGHKVARFALQAGDKVIKYGMSIGSMTQAVAPGSWVHLHNMRSDYLSAHTRTGKLDAT